MHKSIQNNILYYIKTLAIAAGAGARPGLCLLNPKKFGQNGLLAAIIARNQRNWMNPYQ